MWARAPGRVACVGEGVRVSREGSGRWDEVGRRRGVIVFSDGRDSKRRVAGGRRQEVVEMRRA